MCQVGILINSDIESWSYREVKWAISYSDIRKRKRMLRDSALHDLSLFTKAAFFESQHHMLEPETESFRQLHLTLPLPEALMACKRLIQIGSPLLR